MKLYHLPPIVLTVAALQTMSPIALGSPSVSKSISISGEITSVGKRTSSQTSAVTPINTTEGETGRILASPGESFNVRLSLKNTTATNALRVSAGMGGLIDGRGTPLVRQRLGDPNLSLTFTVGTTRGRYLLEMQIGQETKFLEFWVGDEAPQGKPGPQRTFAAPKS